MIDRTTSADTAPAPASTGLIATRARLRISSGLRRLRFSAMHAALFALTLGVACAPAPAQPCFSWSTGFGPPPGALGLNGPVHAMTVFDPDGWGPSLPMLYVGGTFTSAGGVAVNGLAAWDGSAWHDVGGGVTGDTATVYALAVVDLDGNWATAPALYVGGDFTTAGTTPAANIACWNGSSWSALDTGTSGNGGVVRCIAEYSADPTGARLYAGGDFTSAGGITLNFIARWNGVVWSALGTTVGTSGGVFALQQWNDGSGHALFVGGAFPTAGLVDPNTRFIAKWNGTAWSALGAGLNTTVRALTVWDADGPGPLAAVLALGGSFTSTFGGGVSMNRVGTWNGTTWSALGGGLGTSGAVRALRAFDDQCGRTLYAGGDFFSAGGVSFIGRWANGLWQPMGLGTISAVRALCPFVGATRSQSALFAGGDFTAAGGVPSSDIGRWLSADSDGDGLYDCWESAGQGIDINCDGTIDLDLNALGAKPDHKDIFVEIDALDGFEPNATAIVNVKNAFNAAPIANLDLVGGVTLHVLTDEVHLPMAPWTLDDTDGDGMLDWPTEFDALKVGYFGTSIQRSDVNAVNILAAKRLAYRYCIFGHSFNAAGWSGMAEIGGNDFMVTLGLWATSGGTLNQQAGTFMHELGHTLGLYHGGNQIDPTNDRRFNFKPNYHSVMNYTWQTPGTNYVASWELDYSRAAWPALNEMTISEAAGMGGDTAKLVPVRLILPSPPFTQFTFLVPEGGAVMLNPRANNNTTDILTVDINRIFGAPATPGGTLNGHNDWPALDYNFRDSGDFADGAHANVNAVDELDVATKTDLDAVATAPGPCPADIVASNAVNVDDLLAVINAWGACPAPCPPHCAADIAPVPAGDCTVNVDDLLAVINAWGPCP